MLNSIDKDIKAQGYVLRRTNYGEADRILSLITPYGKISAIAKGVRKEKSKLAGGIEVFSLSDFVIHRGKTDFGVITSARMLKYHGEIVKDLKKMEMAAMFLKRIDRLSNDSDSSDYFRILNQSLNYINMGDELSLVEAWFLLNSVKATGEDVNLYRDVEGKKLEAGKRYRWDDGELSFIEKNDGEYGANEIKLLRMMLTNDLGVVKRVKTDEEMRSTILRVAKVLACV